MCKLHTGWNWLSVRRFQRKMHMLFNTSSNWTKLCDKSVKLPGVLLLGQGWSLVWVLLIRLVCKEKAKCLLRAIAGDLNFTTLEGQRRFTKYMLKDQMNTTSWAFPMYFCVFQRWSCMAKLQGLAGRIWPVGCLLRTNKVQARQQTSRGMVN